MSIKPQCVLVYYRLPKNLSSDSIAGRSVQKRSQGAKPREKKEVLRKAKEEERLIELYRANRGIKHFLKRGIN